MEETRNDTDKNEIEALNSKIANFLFKLSNPQSEDLRQYRWRQLEQYLNRLIELKCGNDRR